MRTQKIMQNDEFLKLINGNNSMEGDIPAVFKMIKKNEDKKIDINDKIQKKSYMQVITSNKMPQNIKADLVNKLNVMLVEKAKKVDKTEIKDAMPDFSGPVKVAKKNIPNAIETSISEKRKNFYKCNMNNEKECKIDQINFKCKNGKRNCLCYSIEYLKNHDNKPENSGDYRKKDGCWKKFKKLIDKLNCFRQQLCE
ncbi:hypothetical protein BDAP_001974 [Binucleata daphniae]